MGRLDTILSRRTEGYAGQEVPYELPVTAYPSASGVILVNSPGFGGAQGRAVQPLG